MEIDNFDFGLFTWGALSMASLILWVYCLVDLLTSDFSGSNTKLIWIIIVIFLPFIGSILYLSIGRKQKLRL